MKRLRITIGNKSYEVTVEDLNEDDSFQTPVETPRPTAAPAAREEPPRNTGRAKAKPSSDAGAVTCPMAGAIKSILVQQGDSVRQGQPLLVLEAMKMENQITAPIAGKVKSLEVAVGDSVPEGQVLLILE